MVFENIQHPQLKTGSLQTYDGRTNLTVMTPQYDTCFQKKSCRPGKDGREREQTRLKAACDVVTPAGATPRL